MADANQRRLYSRRLRFEPLESRRVLSITVDTLADENNGVGVGEGTSLREAIAAAAAGDTIDFSVTGTIVTTGLLINKNLTISGPGANLLTIRAYDSTPAAKTGNGTRAFNISDNNTTNLLNVSISGLTLTGGDVIDGGGAILTRENLFVSDCVITNNASVGSSYVYGGGAILSDPGANTFVATSLVVRNSVLSGNSSPNAEGGAIRKRYGTLLVEDCTITNNLTYSAGGGISAADSSVSVQINRSTISNNRATNGSGYGGGMFVYNGTLLIAGSMISGNAAPRGGGITSSNTDLTMTDSVVSNNSATSISGGGTGGGIWVPNGYASLTGCTISGNTATGIGGGLYAPSLLIRDSTVSRNSAGQGGGVAGAGKIINSTFSYNSASAGSAISKILNTLTITSSTITKNTAPTTSLGAIRGAVVSSSIVAGNTNGDVGSGTSSLGYNLVGTVFTAGSFTSTGDQSGVTNPMLGPLADNGGPRKTHAPLAGSPAIDTGNPSFNPSNPDGNPSTNDAMPFDERGAPFTRVFGGRLDKGAVELQPVSAVVMGDYNQNGVVDSADYLVWQKTRGTTGLTPYTGADGSGNGVVDQADYALWRMHFGSTVPAAGAGSGASNEVQAARTELTVRDVEDVAVAKPVAEARSGLPVEVRSIKFGGSARALHPVGPAGAGMSRENALLAWVESNGRAREFRVTRFEAIGRNSIENSGDDSCDALDVAVGEFVGAALL